jgi:putative ABC transport system substrate-binding protein
MNRRDTVLALVALGAAPLASFAQQSGKVWRIGFFYLGSREMTLDRYRIFLEGMRELGYAEGKNFVVELRFAEGKYDRLPGISAELVGLKVDVIVANGTAVYRALQRATTIIPIVITTSPDPVGEGFATSLARPGEVPRAADDCCAEFIPRRSANEYDQRRASGAAENCPVCRSKGRRDGNRGGRAHS